jgi:hypothetical protein
MSIRTPGFTVLENLKQNDIRATEMLSNLLSRAETQNFSVVKGEGSDLQVFQNNVNNESTFSHRNLSLQGEDHIITTFVFPYIGRNYFQIRRPDAPDGFAGARDDLTKDFEIELNGEDYTPRIRPEVFDQEGFRDANGNRLALNSVQNTVHLARFGSFHFIGIPKTFFSDGTIDSPPNNLTPLSVGDSVKLFEPGGNYSLSFVNDEMKIEVPSSVETFTESDSITKISFGAIDDNTPPAETNTDFAGTFTIKDFVRDKDTSTKSFIIGGKTFTAQEQTDAINAFNQSSVIITRKNGVDKQAFLNVGEYATELYDDTDEAAPVELLNIDKDETYTQIFSDINSNIDAADEKIKKLVIRREDNDIFDRVNVSGIVRFSDQQNNVSEENNTISPTAPGLFLLKSALDTPREIKRAFSETSELWEVNSSNNIQIKNTETVTKAEISGKLIFEEGISIDVDDGTPPLEILDQSPHADANGSWNDNLTVPNNNETFTHRMILTVDEFDEDGDAVSVEYGVLAIRAD